jgi:hypothetical protein
VAFVLPLLDVLGELVLSMSLLSLLLLSYLLLLRTMRFIELTLGNFSSVHTPSASSLNLLNELIKYEIFLFEIKINIRIEFPGVVNSFINFKNSTKKKFQ